MVTNNITVQLFRERKYTVPKWNGTDDNGAIKVLK